MHEQQGSVCKYAVSLENRIKCNRKKTRMAESGGTGGAHPWSRPSRCNGGLGVQCVGAGPGDALGLLCCGRRLDQIERGGRRRKRALTRGEAEGGPLVQVKQSQR